MQIRRFARALIFLGMFCLSTAALADDIVIAADTWCPYNCEATSRDRGFMVDVATEILGKQGYTVVYRNDSWTKALRDAGQGRIDAVVGAGASEAKDLIAAMEPLGINKTCLYARASNPFQYRGVDSLNSVKLGVISGYLYGGAIDQYVEQNRIHYQKVQLVTGDKPLLQNVKKLQAGRIDALVENEMVMDFSQRKFDLKGLRNAGCDQDTPLFIAFSPKRPDARRLAEYMNAGVPLMRRSGRFKQILDRYGVKDWR